MSKFYDDLMTGLNEAVAIERGELKGRKTVYEIQPVKKYDNIQIKQIRTEVGMTQVLFANYMGVSCKTVEAWEAGTNHPSGSASRILSMMEINKDLTTQYPFVRTVSG